MSSINPTPNYHNPGLPPTKGHKYQFKMLSDEGYKRNKTGHIQKNMMEEKVITGRLMSHIKLIEMKNYIHNIKSQEGTLKEKVSDVE